MICAGADSLRSGGRSRPRARLPRERGDRDVFKSGALHAKAGFVLNPSQLRYQPGDDLGDRYRLMELLGEGGTAWIFRAHARERGHDVAIKIIRPRPPREDDDPESVRSNKTAARLLVEATAAAAIGHRSIVNVLDLGTTPLGDPFLVMELLRGDSLADLIDLWGKVPAKAAVGLVLPIAEALVAAHDLGILHRDVKPENILVVPMNGAGARLPKLVDFGIARMMEQEGDRLTRAGSLLGSPCYMAPEQVRGEHDVDTRADVWALSVVLYELVKGRNPFSRNVITKSLLAICNVDPDPLDNEPDLWAILAEGMSKDRAQRPTMQALGARLASWLTAKGGTIDVTGSPLSTWLGGPPRLSEPTIIEPPRDPEFDAKTQRRKDAKRGYEEDREPIPASDRPSVTAPMRRRRRAAWAAAIAAAVALVAAGISAGIWHLRSPSVSTLEPR